MQWKTSTFICFTTVMRAIPRAYVFALRAITAISNLNFSNLKKHVELYSIYTNTKQNIITIIDKLSVFGIVLKCLRPDKYFEWLLLFGWQSVARRILKVVGTNAIFRRCPIKYIARVRKLAMRCKTANSNET